MTTLTEAVRRIPTFKQFCEKHGLSEEKMEGHGGMWARVAIEDCHAALLAEPAAPQAEQSDERVWNAMSRRMQARTSMDNVADVRAALRSIAPAPVAEPAASGAGDAS